MALLFRELLLIQGDRWMYNRVDDKVNQNAIKDTDFMEKLLSQMSSPDAEGAGEGKGKGKEKDARDSDSESMKARRSQSQPPVPHAPPAPAVHAPARARTPSPGPSRPSMSFAQPGSPLPPVPRIPSVYGRASLENANSTASHPARARPPREPSHPRGRDPAPAPVAHALAAAPTPVPGYPGPVGVSNPTPTFPPVPSSSSYGRATPDRAPSGSGKLRKNRASTQDGRTNHS